MASAARILAGVANRTREEETQRVTRVAGRTEEEETQRETPGTSTSERAGAEPISASTGDLPGQDTSKGRGTRTRKR